MTALLTVPKLEPIANTMEEAVLQKRSFTMENETPLSRMFLVNYYNIYLTCTSCCDKIIYLLKSAEEGYEKDIGDQLRRDQTFWSKDPLEALDNVVHRKCAYPTVINYIQILIK